MLHPSAFILALARRTVVTFLALLLIWFSFTWTSLGRSRSRNSRLLGCVSRRMSLGQIALRSGRQSLIFQTRFGDGTGKRSVVRFLLAFVNRHLSAFELQLTLTLLVHFLHVFRHGRRFREVFLRLVLKKLFHIVHEEGQRAVSTGHLVAEVLLAPGVAHPDSSHICRRVTDEPNVGVIVNCAGLTCERDAEGLRCRGGTALNDTAHHRN